MGAAATAEEAQHPGRLLAPAASWGMRKQRGVQHSPQNHSPGRMGCWLRGVFFSGL